jgi:lipoprotein-releasing system ATP-binding protein
MAKSQSHISTVAIERTYRKGPLSVPVLRGVDLAIERGEFVSIIGQSGSGKSTLLHLMGLLDSPTIGEIRFEGQRVDDLPAATRDELRNRVFGFIFQFYHLLPELTLLENVLTPMMIRHSAIKYWKNRKTFKAQAHEIIERVGLDHRIKHRPSELSGGEMQRAAIARALVAQPELLLADEPTGNLDSKTGGEIMDLLATLNKERGLTIVMVTHDNSIAEQANRIVRIDNGRIDIQAGKAA